jgi:crotonobetainyl-CoA:carnitine CoA-transferase CaiB-like acyl-CoA transferase
MLRGVRIIDLSRLLPGPMATWYLRGFGAEIIKVEEPKIGDYLRFSPPFRADGTSAWFAALNAGKRSVAIDLKTAAGKAAMSGLIDGADILVESFRPGVLARLGLDPQALRISHPRLIIASITGFGQNGPRRHDPGHDLGYCGLAGALSLNARHQGIPDLPGLPIADLAGGALSAAMTICAALFARERSGAGAWLDLSMTDGVLALMSPYLAAAAAGSTAAPGDDLLTGGWLRYGIYRCKDGKLIALAAIEDQFWAQLTELLGVDEPSDEAQLAAIFRRHDRDHWATLLAPACVTPVLELEEVLRSPLHRDRGALRGEGEDQRVAPSFFSDPEFVTQAAPALGEANAELL